MGGMINRRATWESLRETCGSLPSQNCFEQVILLEEVFPSGSENCMNHPCVSPPSQNCTVLIVIQVFSKTGTPSSEHWAVYVRGCLHCVQLFTCVQQNWQCSPCAVHCKSLSALCLLVSSKTGNTVHWSRM